MGNGTVVTGKRGISKLLSGKWSYVLIQDGKEGAPPTVYEKGEDVSVSVIVTEDGAAVLETYVLFDNDEDVNAYITGLWKALPERARSDPENAQEWVRRFSWINSRAAEIANVRSLISRQEECIKRHQQQAESHRAWADETKADLDRAMERLKALEADRG